MNQVIPSPPPFRSTSRRCQPAGMRNPRNIRSDPRRSRCHDVRRHTPSPNAACFTSLPRCNTPTVSSSAGFHSTDNASTSPGVDFGKQATKAAGAAGWNPIRISPQASPCPSPRLPREARRRPRYNRRQEQEERQKRAQEKALDKQVQGRATLKSHQQDGQPHHPQPRHPEESAPPTSHPASLDELSLPFREGSTITDPASLVHYTLVKLIGRGAYALVWRARRSTDSVLVALKCLSTKSLTPAQRELQLLEVELHARSYKQAPSGVVPFYGSWKHPSAPWLWLCMGNCPSGDLYTWLTAGAGSSSSLFRPNCPLRRRYWLEILTAVREMHSVGVSHRDLKPENFLISAKNSILLGDFGLATADVSSDDWECGSRPYMSPEVRNYPQLDLDSSNPVPASSAPYMPHLADTWSLGIVYLNLLYRSPAWSTPDETCPAYASFSRDPETWLRDGKGVEKVEERDWLIQRVFVPESARCTAAEWLEWEQGRNLNARQGISWDKSNLVANQGGHDQANGATVMAVSGKTVRIDNAKITESHDTPSHHSAPASTTSVQSRITPCHHYRQASWADDEDWNSVMDFSTPLVFDAPVVKKKSTPVKCKGTKEKDGKEASAGKERREEAEAEVRHQDEENPFMVGNQTQEEESCTGLATLSDVLSLSHRTPSTNLIQSFRLLQTKSSSFSSSSSTSSSSSSLAYPVVGSEVNR